MSTTDAAGDRKFLHRVIDALPQESLFDGAWVRSAVRGDASMTTFNWLTADLERQPVHSHPFDQVSIVLAGTMRFDIDGQTLDVTKGEVLVISAGVPHTATVVSSEQVFNIDVFAPPRKDYLHLVEHQSDDLEPADAVRP